jgi:hypothetical protein
MDPRKSKRPELPVTGPGRGGRVGASATQHVVQNLVRDTTRDEDVRASAFLPLALSLVTVVLLVCPHLMREKFRITMASDTSSVSKFLALTLTRRLIISRSPERHCSSMRSLRKRTRSGLEVG